MASVPAINRRIGRFTKRMTKMKMMAEVTRKVARARPMTPFSMKRISFSVSARVTTTSRAPRIFLSGG